jgi:hypothetical protein
MNSARAVRTIVPRAPARALHATARRRAVEDSPLSHSTPPKKGSGPLPLIAGLTVLLGGGYYYYATTESSRIDESKRELERRAAKPAAIAEEAKLRTQEAARDARDRTVEGARDTRDAAEAKWAQTKGAAERTYEDGKARANSAVSAAQAKADDAKRYTGASNCAYLSGRLAHASMQRPRRARQNRPGGSGSVGARTRRRRLPTRRRRQPTTSSVVQTRRKSSSSSGSRKLRRRRRQRAKRSRNAPARRRSSTGFVSPVLSRARISRQDHIDNPYVLYRSVTIRL